MTTSRFTTLSVGLMLILAACTGTQSSSVTAGNSSRPATAEPSESETAEPSASADDGASASGDPEEFDSPQPRLVVGDGEAGSVSLLDLDSGEVIGSFETAEPVYLSTSSTGRLVYLIQYESDTVDVLDAGTWSEPHGDHSHYFVAEPTLLEPISGPNPAHVVGHDGVTAVFTDGNGEALLFDENDLSNGDAESETVATGKSHHGVVIHLGDQIVATLPDPDAEDGALPYGIQVLEEEGQTVAESADCPELHGEVSTWEGMAFACADGILVVDPRGADSAFTKVAYPEDAKGLRAWSLVGDELDEVVFGALSGEATQNAILRADLASGTTEQFPLPSDASAIALDPEGTALFAVTADGQLHLIDPDSGEVRASAPVVEAFEYGGDAPAPQLAVAGGHVYVSDPAAGTVVEVHFDDELEVERTFDVGGAPQILVVVGAR